jgi:pimeloyl-ACP methyl ester carboxylesterase
MSSAAAGTLPVTTYRRARLETGIEKIVEVGGHVYHYWDKGDGPTVLLLHGLGGSAYDWRHVFDDLAAAGFRAIAYEMLGAGYSDKPAKVAYTIEAQAERAARFLPAIGVPRAHVVGNSYGGALGLRLAAKHGEVVDRLVLLSAASLPQKLPFHVALLRTRGVAEVAMTLSSRKMMVRTTLKDVFHDPKKIREEDVAEYAHEMGLPGTQGALLRLARQLEIASAGKYASSYRRIRAKTLLLWGQEDRITPVKSGHELRELIPGSRLLTIPNGGHCPHMEYPQPTLLALLEFLRS